MLVNLHRLYQEINEMFIFDKKNYRISHEPANIYSYIRTKLNISRLILADTYIRNRLFNFPVLRVLDVLNELNVVSPVSHDE